MHALSDLLDQASGLFFVVSFRFIQKQRSSGRSFRNAQIGSNRAIPNAAVKLHRICPLTGLTVRQITGQMFFCLWTFELESRFAFQQPH